MNLIFRLLGSKGLSSFLLLWILAFQLHAQQGCTEPRALNFNQSATVNDGTCRFPNTTVSPMVRADLTTVLEESSALLYSGSNTVWTLNDSGNQPSIYLVDTATGLPVKEVRITNVGNDDWEALAEDADHIYIGDFGNNDGNRRNLRILIVNKSAIGPGLVSSVTASQIRFSYPDQTSFNSSNTHNFDCEAFVCYNDTLHLFTKNWGNYQTKHYTLPTLAGTYVATLVNSYNVNCLVTDATVIVNTDGKPQLALLGYDQRDLSTSLWLFWDMDHLGRPFSMNRWLVRMPSMLGIGQVEGICFKNPHSLFISSEKRNPLPPRLYSITRLPHQMPITTGLSQTTSNQQLKYRYDAEASKLIVQLPNVGKSFVFFLYDLTGKIIYQQLVEAGVAELSVSTDLLPDALYCIQVSGIEVSYKTKFIKY